MKDVRTAETALPLNVIAAALAAVVLAAGLCAPARGADPGGGSKEPTPWYVYYQQGLQAMANDDWSGASSLIEKAVGEHSLTERSARTYGMWQLDYVPYYNLATCYFYLGRDADSLRALDKSEALKEIPPESPMRQKLQRIRKALQTGGRSVATTAKTESTGGAPAETPPRPRAETGSSPDRLARGLSLLIAGDAESAIDVFQALLRGHEESADLHFYLGLAYARRMAQQRQANPSFWRNLTQSEFARAQRIDPDLRPIEGLFSDDVLKLFKEASQK